MALMLINAFFDKLLNSLRDSVGTRSHSCVEVERLLNSLCGSLSVYYEPVLNAGLMCCRHVFEHLEHWVVVSADLR